MDDGSTDETAAVVRRWVERFPRNILLLQQENAGPAAARNLGLTHATGEWISCVDADDFLAPTYFQTVRDFLAGSDYQGDVVACNTLLFHEAEQRASDGHPLAYKFQETRVVDLLEEPDCIQLSVPSCLVRRQALEATGLRFDVRVRPTFEDAHFLNLLLLRRGNFRVAFLKEAHYLYRKRGGGLLEGALPPAPNPGQGQDPGQAFHLPPAMLPEPQRGILAQGTPTRQGWVLMDHVHKARERAPGRTILFCPTWREHLRRTEAHVPGLPPEEARHFQQSDFFRAWSAVTGSRSLARLAREHGYKLLFLPHPEVTRFLPLFPRSEAFSFLEWGNLKSVQEVLVSCAVGVTDYSSLAFELGYLGRPVAYYQFPETPDIYAAHVCQRGYFDCETHGLGPVLPTVEALEAWLDEAMRQGGRRQEPYEGRAAALRTSLRRARVCICSK